MDGNSGPARTAPVALVSLIVAWLRGKIAGIRLCPGSCFSPVFYREIQEASL
jgi:hypothetical protein